MSGKKVEENLFDAGYYLAIMETTASIERLLVAVILILLALLGQDVAAATNNTMAYVFPLVGAVILIIYKLWG